MSTTRHQFPSLRERGPVLGRFSSPVPILERGEYASMVDEKYILGDKDSCHIERVLETGQLCSKKGMKLGKQKTHAARNLDLIKILVESYNSLKEEQYPIEDYVRAPNTLPLRFRFEDEVQPCPEKSEWEKQMDSLFCDLELGLRETEIHRSNPSVVHLPLAFSYLSQLYVSSLICLTNFFFHNVTQLFVLNTIRIHSLFELRLTFNIPRSDVYWALILVHTA
ncbi:UNVERIFIED_CONTAM: hypothetical protein Sangu_0070600 [Sesamum angustifolium]|uniref:Uncharacterized protein n=1 Tax=Sesamum angustifolium TaxID=2727405 RepID=A0AAW2RJQ4_9LAMI